MPQRAGRTTSPHVQTRLCFATLPSSAVAGMSSPRPTPEQRRGASANRPLISPSSRPAARCARNRVLAGEPGSRTRSHCAWSAHTPILTLLRAVAASPATPGLLPSPRGTARSRACPALGVGCGPGDLPGASSRRTRAASMTGATTLCSRSPRALAPGPEAPPSPGSPSRRQSSQWLSIRSPHREVRVRTDRRSFGVELGGSSLRAD